MTRLHLVRHGRAAAGWDRDPDPDLDDLGREQAAAMAAVLGPIGPSRLVTSPLRRCRSTAAALAAVWGVDPIVEPRVAEIPSPDGVAMADRVAWLREAMAGEWVALGARYTAYRDDVVGWATACTQDTVVVSHFVAINAIIGACLGDDRLVIRRLDNCSVTVVDVLDGRPVLVTGGDEADTLIR